MICLHFWLARWIAFCALLCCAVLYCAVLTVSIVVPKVCLISLHLCIFNTTARPPADTKSELQTPETEQSVSDGSTVSK